MRPHLLLPALLLLVGCGTPQQAAGSGSQAGVLACADTVVWGTVTRVEPGPAGLRVALDVRSWVHPASGPDELVVVADDPEREVGAPAWRPGPARLLVVVSPGAPVQPLAAAEGERAVQQWREDGSRRSPASECEKA